MTTTTMYRAEPLGPFDLENQNRYFGGWLTPAGAEGILMAFPVEGWRSSAAVWVRQEADGRITGEVSGTDATDDDASWRQAVAALSLDADGRRYPEVGRRDPVIGALQAEHAHLRPVLFHSPYEAACSFVIGHRMSIRQGRAIRARMAREHGEALELAGTTVHAFPAPQRLLAIDAFPGLTPEKVDRLHGIARAALDGVLDRARLRSLPTEEAMATVLELRGIGPFFAAGIVLRGAGLVDAVPNDEITAAGVRRLYGEQGRDLDAVAETWRPYRMWCSVLVHVDERRHREASASPRA
jgi:DNA-3-methyladenine glycosylase II